MNVILFGRRGKVGSVLGPALEAAGHTLVESTHDADVAVDFTRPEAVAENVRVALEDRVPVVVGTTGFDQERVAALAAELLAPDRLSIAGIGPSDDRFAAAAERVNPQLALAA